MGHGPCQTFIESCPQGVLQTERVVIQPESSGCVNVFILSKTNSLFQQEHFKYKTHDSDRPESRVYVAI